MRNRPRLKMLIAEKLEEHAQIEHVSLLISEYERKGSETGNGAFHAAVDDQFGTKSGHNELAENRLLVERSVLKELMKRGHSPLEVNETRQTAISRIAEDPCLAHLENHLKQLDEKIHHKRQHRIHEARSHLHHLAHSKPERNYTPNKQAGDCTEFTVRVQKHEAEVAEARAQLQEAEAPCPAPR